VRVPKVEALSLFGHDDRRLAIGGEVHVVRVINGDGGAGFGSSGIDGGKGPVRSSLGVVSHPQRCQVIGGNDVLWVDTDFEAVDDPHGHGIDHRDVVGSPVRDVHPRQRSPDD
jgi:hypothetical protein